MDFETVYSSEYIVIKRGPDGYYLESFKRGLSLEQFTSILNENPQIKITNFMVIKNAILFPPKPLQRFAEEKPAVVVEISKDELKAYITLNLPEESLKSENLVNLFNMIMATLKDNGVIYGIKNEAILTNLCSNKQILVAEGVSPLHGQDSIIKIFTIEQPKPEIKEDGSADYYHLNLINRVLEGEWLGDRTDPVDGVPGISVTGRVISAIPGKKFPLLYDKKSVREEFENGITTLYALKNGAVNIEDGKISVSNHLVIDNNVDFRTGNVNFDGFLTIKGTVEDGFSVVSQYDIEIEGEMGVGSVKEIISREGSIYIKGGITGKNRTVIKAKKNVYVKYVSDAQITCGGLVHVGFYCINSDISAKEVIVDSVKGQIMGGNIEVERKVAASQVGSHVERRTSIVVDGFDREKVKARLEKLIEIIEDYKFKTDKLRQDVMALQEIDNKDRFQRIQYEKLQEEYSNMRKDLICFEEERIYLAGCLKIKGDGEVAVGRKVYPGTVISIKKCVREISTAKYGVIYSYQDGEIVEK